MDPAVLVTAFYLHLLNELTQCHIIGRFDYMVMIIDIFSTSSSETARKSTNSLKINMPAPRDQDTGLC